MTREDLSTAIVGERTPRGSRRRFALHHASHSSVANTPTRGRWVGPDR